MKHLTREAELQVDIFETWINRLRELSVPIGSESIDNTHNVRYGLYYSIWGYSVSLLWGEHSPKAWQPIIDWYHAFKAWLQSELDKTENLSKDNIPDEGAKQ